MALGAGTRMVRLFVRVKALLAMAPSLLGSVYMFYWNHFRLTGVKRGGQGNITTPGFKLTQKRGQDVVPEAALRARPDHEDYHVGVCQAPYPSI